MQKSCPIRRVMFLTPSVTASSFSCDPEFPWGSPIPTRRNLLESRGSCLKFFSPTHVFFSPTATTFPVEQHNMVSDEDSPHIPMSQLWEYSRHPSALEWTQLEHLASCEDCIGILWVCRTSESVQQVKDSLGKHGITGDC